MSASPSPTTATTPFPRTNITSSTRKPRKASVQPTPLIRRATRAPPAFDDIELGFKTKTPHLHLSPSVTRAQSISYLRSMSTNHDSDVLRDLEIQWDKRRAGSNTITRKDSKSLSWGRNSPGSLSIASEPTAAAAAPASGVRSPGLRDLEAVAWVKEYINSEDGWERNLACSPEMMRQLKTEAERVLLMSSAALGMERDRGVTTGMGVMMGTGSGIEEVEEGVVEGTEMREKIEGGLGIAEGPDARDEKLDGDYFGGLGGEDDESNEEGPLLTYGGDMAPHSPGNPRRNSALTNYAGSESPASEYFSGAVGRSSTFPVAAATPPSYAVATGGDRAMSYDSGSPAMSMSGAASPASNTSTMAMYGGSSRASYSSTGTNPSYGPASRSSSIGNHPGGFESPTYSPGPSSIGSYAGIGMPPIFASGSLSYGNLGPGSTYSPTTLGMPPHGSLEPPAASTPIAPPISSYWAEASTPRAESHPFYPPSYAAMPDSTAGFSGSMGTPGYTAPSMAPPTTTNALLASIMNDPRNAYLRAAGSIGIGPASAPQEPAVTNGSPINIGHYLKNRDTGLDRMFDPNPRKPAKPLSDEDIEELKWISPFIGFGAVYEKQGMDSMTASMKAVEDVRELCREHLPGYDDSHYPSGLIPKDQTIEAYTRYMAKEGRVRQPWPPLPKPKWWQQGVSKLRGKADKNEIVEKKQEKQQARDHVPFDDVYEPGFGQDLKDAGAKELRKRSGGGGGVDLNRIEDQKKNHTTDTSISKRQAQHVVPKKQSPEATRSDTKSSYKAIQQEKYFISGSSDMVTKTPTTTLKDITLILRPVPRGSMTTQILRYESMDDMASNVTKDIQSKFDGISFQWGTWGLFVEGKPRDDKSFWCTSSGALEKEVLKSEDGVLRFKVKTCNDPKWREYVDEE